MSHDIVSMAYQVALLHKVLCLYAIIGRGRLYRTSCHYDHKLDTTTCYRMSTGASKACPCVLPMFEGFASMPLGVAKLKPPLSPLSHTWLEIEF